MNTNLHTFNSIGIYTEAAFVRFVLLLFFSVCFDVVVVAAYPIPHSTQNSDPDRRILFGGNLSFVRRVERVGDDDFAGTNSDGITRISLLLASVGVAICCCIGSVFSLDIPLRSGNIPKSSRSMLCTVYVVS